MLARGPPRAHPLARPPAAVPTGGATTMAPHARRRTRQGNTDGWLGECLGEGLVLKSVRRCDRLVDHRTAVHVEAECERRVGTQGIAPAEVRDRAHIRERRVGER